MRTARRRGEGRAGGSTGRWRSPPPDVITSSSPEGLTRRTCGKRSSSSSPTGWTRRVPWRMGQAGRTVSGCGGSSLRQETEKGYFGPFGGRYVPETLIHALEELEEAYERYRDDPEFGEERDRLARDFVGRPTPLMSAERLTREWGGANVWFKREDLAHTGAHKINNTLGQILLADRMGKERIIAETGAGQHGVATATVSALYGKECIVYMGEEDTRRQRLNVVRMKLLGAEVVPVLSGSRTLKDAVNEAIRDWVTNVEDTHYIIGSVVGPAPYPRIVRDLQSVIGTEIEAQSRERLGSDPDAIVACVGAGSNAIGAFYPFVGRENVRLVGVEAAGRGLTTGEHGASLAEGRLGVLLGPMSYCRRSKGGRVRGPLPFAPGLEHPATGPEHAFLKDEGLAEYASVTDGEALEALETCSRLEGIIPALETAHAIYYAEKVARELGRGKNMVINISGRGDKDVEVAANALGIGSKEAQIVAGPDPSTSSGEVSS